MNRIETLINLATVNITPTPTDILGAYKSATNMVNNEDDQELRLSSVVEWKTSSVKSTDTCTTNFSQS